MRTYAGNFNIQADVTDVDETTVILTHTDPSPVVIDYRDGSTGNISSGGGSGKFWAVDYKGPISLKFPSFDTYATELEIQGMIGLRIDQMPKTLTRFDHNGGNLNIPDPYGSGEFVRYPGLTMGGTSLPTGLVDLHVENVRSAVDVDKIIDALEVNAQNNGSLFLAEQRLNKTPELLESRGWDVEVEPQYAHKIERSRAPHTSIIDGKVMHHVDRRRGGDRRKQFEGRCIELNGTSEYAETGGGLVWTGADALTISVWVNVTDTTGFVIGHWNSGTTHTALVQIENVGLPKVYISMDGTTSNYRVVQDSTDIRDGNWHHIALRYKAGTLEGYIDGVLFDGSVTTVGSGTTINQTPSTIALGANTGGAGATEIAASIKHPRIYDSALTDAQIAALAAEAPQKQLATSLPTPLIDLPMDDATTSPIIRNHGSLGQSGDFTLTGTPSSIWTTCDRVSLPNEHGCSVGLVTDGSTGYLDTGITLDGATAFTVWRRARYLSTSAYDLDGFYNPGGSTVRIGRDTGNEQILASIGTNTGVTPGTAVPNGVVHTIAASASVSGTEVLKYNNATVSSSASGMAALTNSLTYRIGNQNPTAHPSHTEYCEYLIADRVLTDDELLWLESYGVSGTAIDIEGDANILAYYDFQSPDPHVVANLADPGNPAKIVGGCEWVAINRDAANPTQDMNGKALTFSGPVPRDAVILSQVATLNGSSEYITGPVWTSPDIAISFWFKQPATASSATIISSWVSASNKKQFILNSDASGPLRFLVQSSAGGSDVIAKTYTTAVDDNQWHHVYAEIVGSTMRLFLDGAEEDVTATTGTAGSYGGALYATDQPIRIAAAESVVPNFAGSVCNVRLYETGLTSSQIADLAAGVDAGEATLCYPLCEGSGNVAHDTSGNGNHGTITGSVWDGDQQDASDVLITNGFAKGTIYDGSSDYFSRATLVGGATKLCVSFWVRVDSLAATAVVASEYDTTGDQRSWQIAVQTDGKLRVNFSSGGDTGTTGANTTDAAVITAGELHHVSLTFDAGVMVWEVDGVVAASSWTTTITSLFATSATLSISGNSTAGALLPGTLSQLLIHKDPTAVWGTATKAAIRAAGTTEDIAAIVENLGGTAWWFQDGSGTESLQGIAALTENGSPTETVIPAGAGVPISYGPGVPAPGQSRVIAPEPNSPFALRYAQDYQLDEGALAYEAVFGSGSSRVDLGSALIGATDDFDISLDFIRTSTGSDTYQGIFAQYTAATAGRMLFYERGATYRFYVDDGGGTDINLDSVTAPALNEWTTVRVTRVGDVFTLYINGTQEATQTQAGVSVEQSNFFLSENDTVFDEFNGRMRNLRIDNNGTVTEYLTQNIALPGATLTNVTLSSKTTGAIGGRILFQGSDNTANLYEEPMSAEMAEIIGRRKYS